MSSPLWYPGRIPLCTPQVVYGLQQYIDTLRTAAIYQDTTSIGKTNRIYQDIHAILYEEGCSCLGSDADINNLLALLTHTQQAVEACAQHSCWDDLEDVIDAIDTVYWSLQLKQENGGTDDGEEPGVVATTDAYGRATDRPDRTQDTQQAERLDDARRKLEAEGTVPGSDETTEEAELKV